MHVASDRAESAASRLRVASLRIGAVVVDPPVLQAPMAGFTDYPYREIVRHYGGAGLMATEMISAKGFAWLNDHKAEYPSRLWGVKEEARPLAVQIWDNDPAALATVGARLARDLNVSVVDINFGCPVKQVTQRAQSGSYLLKDPQRVGSIIERVVEACTPTPVTAKIRLGPTRKNINAIDVAKVVESAGAAALSVHGRTAADHFKGAADWDRISEIKPHLKRMPLIGNGDLDSAEKVVDALNRYAVDGVMIGRASLGRPWIFAQVRAALRGEPIPLEPTLDEQRQCVLHHFDLMVKRFGEEKATILMRRCASKYGRGRPGARAFRTRVAKINSAAEFSQIIQRCFPRDP